MNQLARDLIFIAENRQAYKFFGTVKPHIYPNSLTETIQSFINAQTLLTRAKVEHIPNRNSITVCTNSKELVEQIDGIKVQWVENLTEAEEEAEIDSEASADEATGFELSPEDWTNLLLIQSGDTTKIEQLDIQWLEEAGLVTTASGTPALTDLANEWITSSKQ